MSKKWRWIGIGTTALILGLVIGGSIQVYLSYQRTPNYFIKAAESAYADGMAVWSQNDLQAMTRFHEAILHSENGFKVLEKERTAGPLTPEQQTLFMKQEGLLYWIKMKALRGRCLAKWKSEGKPIPTVEGQNATTPALWLGKLTPNRLPDEAMRQDAVYCLRQAALRLFDVLEVQQEAVALEMQIEPKQWPLAQIVANQLMVLAPKDDRVRYLLARYEYEQPVSANAQAISQPLPVGKRSRDRMFKALEHIVQLKQLENPVRWRTDYLEAEIQSWLLQYARNPNQRKVQDEQKALAALQQLLFDAESGVLARVQKQEHLGPLSRLDTDGLLRLHQMAVDLRLEDMRRGSVAGNKGQAHPPADALTALMQTIEACLQLQHKILTSEPTAWQVAACAESLTLIGAKVQAQLSKDQPDLWQKLMVQMQTVGEQALDKQALDPATMQRLAELAFRDAQWQAKLGHVERQRQRQMQAVQWVDAGLKLGREKQWPAASMLTLHETAGRIKAAQGMQRSELMPHLQALKDAQSPIVQAGAFLLEGALAEREGRLEKARDALEKVVQLAPGTDLARRAHSMLGTLYLTLNQPEKALASLKEIERQYRRWEQLSDDERSWLFEFMRGPQDVVLLQVEANLAVALKTKMLSKHPSVDPDAVRETISRYEQEAMKLTQGFAARSPQARVARERWVTYLFRAERTQEAEKALSQLRSDFPDSLSVMRLEHQWLLRKTNATNTKAAPSWQAIDQQIQQFISLYPQQTAARVYWVEWLLATNRAAEAKAYIEDPTHLPPGNDDRGLQRIRTLVQLMTGDRSVAGNITQTSATDPLLDVAFIQSASSLAIQQQQIDSALQRHESKGIFQCLNARLAFNRGDYVDSAKGYLGAIECTTVRNVARHGLQTALMTMAQSDPVKAREQITLFLQDYPAEPALLISYAQACLLLGDIGQPQQRDNKIKDMASALQALEASTALSGQPVYAAAWTKAQFWHQAQRPDLVQAELQRVLAQEPKHEGALLMSISLAMESYDPVQCKKAHEQIKLLAQLQPQTPLTALLTAQLLEKESHPAEALQVLQQITVDYPVFAPAYGEWVKLSMQLQSDIASVYPMIKRWREQIPSDLQAARAEMAYLACTGQMDGCRALLDQFMKRASEAMRDSNQAAQLQALQTQVTVTLAQGLIQGKAFSEAESWLKRVLDLRPDDEGALLLLGELYMTQMKEMPPGATRQAKAQQAMQMYAKVYQQRKGHMLAGNNLAWLLAKESNNAAEAYRILREVMQNRYTQAPMPANMIPADVLDTFGMVVMQLNDASMAAELKEMSEAAQRRFPVDPRFCFYSGCAYQMLGQSNAAQAAFNKAVALLNKPLQPMAPLARQSLQNEIQKRQKAAQ